MPDLLLVLLLAASVKDGPAPLRSGCSPDARVLASLPSGTPVALRYSINGESGPCYKVSVEVDGKTLEGSLPGSAIDHMEDFDRARSQAIWMDTPLIVNAIRESAILPSIGPSSGVTAGTVVVAQKAYDLIGAGKPQRALELLEPELKTHRDSGLLALAGVAAWRSDDPRQALDYLRASLDLAPRPEVEKLYLQVEREAKNDHSTDRLYGLRVLLRYESAVVPIETARQMTTVLDQEFIRISQTLGCSAQERVIAIVQSRDSFLKSTGSAEWAGGQFDGKIRVPVFDPKVLDQQMLRALAHETAHACLTMLGEWPAWLQEGIAQKVSGDSLSAAQMNKIAGWIHEGKMSRLSSLKQDWSRLDAEHAAMSYTLSLAAVELLWKDTGEDGVRNLLRNPDRLPQVTAELDRKLGL
jgi:hypothetical protein